MTTDDEHFLVSFQWRKQRGYEEVVPYKNLDSCMLKQC
jgi:hypothetical protein